MQDGARPPCVFLIEGSEIFMRPKWSFKPCWCNWMRIWRLRGAVIICCWMWLQRRNPCRLTLLFVWKQIKKIWKQTWCFPRLWTDGRVCGAWTDSRFNLAPRTETGQSEVCNLWPSGCPQLQTILVNFDPRRSLLRVSVVRSPWRQTDAASSSSFLYGL